MAITYIRFDAAMKAQGIQRTGFLPVTSRLQPYAAYWALLWAGIFIWIQGYAVFLSGNWSVATFIFNYGIVSSRVLSKGTSLALLIRMKDRLGRRDWLRVQDLWQDTVPQEYRGRSVDRSRILRYLDRLLPAHQRPWASTQCQRQNHGEDFLSGRLFPEGGVGGEMARERFFFF